MPVKVSVVIPAYNEGKKIAEVLERLKNILQTAGQPYEMIVVNDGSTDDTAQKARACGGEIIEHKENLGYGRSLKDGIRLARGELILLIDADGTYDIDKIPAMLQAAKNADLVVGSRQFSKKDTNRFKNVARRYFAYHTSYYSGKRVEDLNSGQRVFKRRDVIDALHALPDGFSFTSTLTVRCLVQDKKIVYIPVSYQSRSKDSKFISGAHFFAIAKLAFTLTVTARPFKAALQLGCVFAAAALLARITGTLLPVGFFGQLAFFAALCPFFLLIFLSYIYVMGKAVTRRQ